MKKNIFEVRKAFREARTAGEEKLLRGEITWEQYSFVMLGFEAQLRCMGETL